MILNDLIQELGKRCGNEFAVEDGVCTLGIDDMTVTVQEIDEVGVISTYADIGEPPPQGLEKLFESMLVANYLFAGTAGSTISFNSERRVFVLCRVDPVSMMDGEKFCNMLEKFVNTLESWRKLLADYRPLAENSSSAENTESYDDVGFGIGNHFMQV